jgi:uncharacterized protein YtpQ (UPF0354 family)
MFQCRAGDVESIGGAAQMTQAERLSPGEFTAEVANILRSELPTSSITAALDLELAVKGRDGGETKALLHNAYQGYVSGASADPADAIRNYVAGFVEMQRRASAKLDPARIVPVIKDRQWLVEVQAAARGAGRAPPEVVHERLNDELDVVYAEDSANNISYLLRQKVEQAGVPQAGIRALAIANLKRMLTRIELHGGPLVSMITAGGNYESSLMLFDDMWSNPDLRASVEGDIVTAVPARDVLLFTGSRNAAGVSHLHELATRSVKQASHRLTDTLFVYRDGRFTRFDGN